MQIEYVKEPLYLNFWMPHICTLLELESFVIPYMQYIHELVLELDELF